MFPTTSGARVSRTELARNREVWLLTGGMYAFFAVTLAAMPFVLGSFEVRPMLILAGLLAGIGALHLTSEPPPIGSWRNHLVLASLYLSPWLATTLIRPEGGEIALGAAMFIAPLTAMRLTDRRQIAAHLTAASVTLIGVCVSGLLPFEVSLAALTTIPSMWVLAGCVVVVLEAAEMQGEELEGLVRRDPLTGIGNRRLLMENLETELARHGRISRPLSVLALDLNGFKALNDTVGHAAGDELLREVATALTSVVGPHDTVVRQGGDEFCLLLTETSPAEATRAANGVRAALAQIRAGDGPLTTGIGIASYPQDAVHAGVLLHVADERLLESKGHGPAGASKRPSTPGLTVWRSAS